MEISKENIITEGLKTTFIWSSTYKRIFMTVGPINKNNESGNDNIPTLLVDRNGGMYDFLSLLAEKCFNISLDKDFKYSDYIKNITN